MERTPVVESASRLYAFSNEARTASSQHSCTMPPMNLESRLRRLPCTFAANFSLQASVARWFWQLSQPCRSRHTLGTTARCMDRVIGRSQPGVCPLQARPPSIPHRHPQSADLPPLQFDYKPSPLHIIDNGHTIMIKWRLSWVHPIPHARLCFSWCCAHALLEFRTAIASTTWDGAKWA
jgi:hypothetical protein